MDSSFDWDLIDFEEGCASVIWPECAILEKVCWAHSWCERIAQLSLKLDSLFFLLHKSKVGTTHWLYSGDAIQYLQAIQQTKLEK